MIWSIVISLIPIFIIVFIVLHSFEIFGSSLSDNFQALIRPQNQREENETFHSNDFENPTNGHLSSQSVFSQQDETIGSRAFSSEEVSSSNPERCYTNSQLASNPKDLKNINAASCSNILNRNNKAIDCIKSLSENIQPDKMIENCLSSRDITSENLIGKEPMGTELVFTLSSKNENENIPSKDIHCRNLEDYCSNTQLVPKQQDSGKEGKTHEFPDTQNKSSKEYSKVSELLSKQMGDEKEDKGHPFKDVDKKKIEGHLNNFQTLSRLQDRGKDNVSKVNQNKNLEESCSNYQMQSTQQYDGREDKSLLSNDAHNWDIRLNTFQTVSAPQNLEKDILLQFNKGIVSKNLEVNYSNSQLLAKQKDDRIEDQILPFNFPKTNIKRENLEHYIPNLLRRRNSQKNSWEPDRKKDSSLQSKDSQNKNQEGNCSESQSLSQQQNDGKKDKAQSSKYIQKNNIEGHTSRALFTPEEDENYKRLQSKQDQIKNLQVSWHNSLSQSNQESGGTEDKSLPSKDIHNKNTEEYLNQTEIVPNQKSGGTEDKGFSSKRTHNRNPSRYFFNSELASKQKKERMRSRAFSSKIRDNQKGVGSFMCVLFENQLYTDVTFTSKGNNKALLSAHRAVLAAKSEYLKDLLFGDLAKESDGMQMDIEVNNVPFCIFSKIVKWFYTGNIEFSDDQTVLEIYQAAKHFKIQQLIDECKNYIESMKITDHNVCSTLQLCNTLQVNELKIRCVRYIEQNTLSVINSAEFEKSPFTIVREICQLQCLAIASEAEVLEAALRWLNSQPKLKRNAVKELERALLKCVRFLSFGTKEFSDVVSKHAALLTAEESLNILLYLSNPTPDGLESLPKWCNKSRRTFLSEQERKDPGVEKNLSEDSEDGKIKIELKPPDIVQDFSELTSVLHMRCKKGMHRIMSVKFSFQTVENSGCVHADLKIIVNVLPNGTKFLKFYSLRESEITFDFTRAVAVHEGQVLIIEVTAIASQSCKFFQFDKWYNDPKRDFDCFFISKPKTGRLYFISQVTYEPLAPRLNSPH